uniref:Uncharacterized protein n=1 Tax=Anopheles epiroticus TaxID=199890 RepID=A0A182PIT6_9DIPT
MERRWITNAKSFAEEDVIEKSEPTGGKGGHPRHTRKEDKKTKPDDAAPAAPRTTDFPGSKGLPAGERERRLATHPRASIVCREPVDEVVVGKPPSRERVNSTSHYSTEKSGSSGYYSTNLYSTGGSSVDEHIYCEPIDRRSPRTERLDDEEDPSKHGSGTVAKVASQGAVDPVKTGASCDRSRRGNDQELSELQRNIRGLEQYYYPASLASPAVPVQMSVMRAAVIQQPPLHSSSSIGPEGEPQRAEGGCEEQQEQQTCQEQQEQQQLSVIMEGNDGQIPRPIWPLDTDDSLMDINLESFRMANHSSQNLIGFESPTLSSISESEMYALRDQIVDGAGEGTQSRKKSQYEEYLEFHNTRNILEQIRGKLNTLLEQRTEQQQQKDEATSKRIASAGNPFVKELAPNETELEKNIAILKADLDGYLRTMNQKNENEIRRFCKGMSREPKVVAVQNAVEQRNRSRSGSILSLEHDYEMLERAGGVLYPTSCGSESVLPYYQVLPPDICEGRPPAALPAAALVLNRRSPPNPFAQEVRQQSHSGSVGGLHSLCCQQRYLNSDEIRVCNRYGGCERTDPNAMTIDMPESDDGEVGKTFVAASGRAGSGVDCRSVSIGMPDEESGGDRVRYGSRVKLKTDPPGRDRTGCPGAKGDGLSDSGSGGAPHLAHCDFNQLQRNMTLERIILMESLGKSRNGQFGDKEKMLLEWHQNKPSCWELYYGANREEHPPHQTLIRKMKLGRKSTVCISYVSTRRLILLF